MAIARKPDFISAEEYLDGELAAEFRSEYISGEIYSMHAAGKRHGEITSNINRGIGNLLRGSACRPSVGVSVAAPASYLIPDVVV